MKAFFQNLLVVSGQSLAKKINPIKGKDEFLQEIHRNNSQLIGKLCTITSTGKGMKYLTCRMNGTNKTYEGIGDVRLKNGDTVEIVDVVTVAGFPRLTVERFE